MCKKIILIVVVIFLAVSVGSIYLYVDYDNRITVNDEYIYSPDISYVVNTYEDNRSLWMKLRYTQNHFNGATISAVDENGNVENIIHMKDVSISDAYHINEHIYVVYYHVIDFYTDNEIAESCWVADFDLSNLSDYVITEYQNGEIIGMDRENAELIKRSSDVVINHGIGSNVICYNDGLLYVDGTDLVSLNQAGYNIIYSFENNFNAASMYLAENLLYIVSDDGNIVKKVSVFDLNTYTNNEYYETAEEVVDCVVIENDLYLLHDHSIICIDQDGIVTEIVAFEDHNSECFKALFVNAQKDILLLSNKNIRTVDPAGSVISTMKYNQNLLIQEKVME